MYNEYSNWIPTTWYWGVPQLRKSVSQKDFRQEGLPPLSYETRLIFVSFFFNSSGGWWVKINLKLPHFHISETCHFVAASFQSSYIKWTSGAIIVVMVFRRRATVVMVFRRRATAGAHLFLFFPRLLTMVELSHSSPPKKLTLTKKRRKKTWPKTGWGQFHGGPLVVIKHEMDGIPAMLVGWSLGCGASSGRNTFGQ